MSWSIQGVYRDVQHASQSIASSKLPPTIREYIHLGLAGITTKDVPVSIIGHGHLCYVGDGGGNYEVTSAQLEVKSLVFAP
jgi:hypothetical protein